MKGSGFSSVSSYVTYVLRQSINLKFILLLGSHIQIVIKGSNNIRDFPKIIQKAIN